MKHFILTDEEEEILKAYEEGKLVPSKDADQIKNNLIAAAKNTMNKTKNINIRLSEKDLHKVKAKAAEEGLPYQTLLSSVIHKFVNA